MLEELILAHGVDAPLYAYNGRLWIDARDEMTKCVGRLMGDSFRLGQIDNVTAVISAGKNNGHLRVLTDQPAQPKWINFTNGMLNFETGDLFDHMEDFESTIAIPHAWDPDAPTPWRFLEFLDEVIDPGAHQLLLEILGYILIDMNPFQRAAMLYGGKNSGKSTFLALAHAIVGADNCSTLSLQQISGEKFAAANLHKKLLNTSGDLPSGNIKDTSTFKQITGGDTISAEHKFERMFDFQARVFLMFSANEIPQSSDSTESYLDRWIALLFDRTVPKEKQQLDLIDVLNFEIPGILTLIIPALREAIERGYFIETDVTLEMKKVHDAAVDLVIPFVQEHITLDAGNSELRSDVYQIFEVWSKNTGHKGLLGEKRFTPKFRSAVAYMLGEKPKDVKKHDRRAWGGVKLHHQGVPLVDDPAAGPAFTGPETDPL